MVGAAPPGAVASSLLDAIRPIPRVHTQPVHLHPSRDVATQQQSASLGARSKCAAGTAAPGHHIPRPPCPWPLQEYLPIGGHRQFCEDSVKLAYGEDAEVLAGKQVAMIQSLSGTGSCRQGHAALHSKGGAQTRGRCV